MYALVAGLILTAGEGLAGAQDKVRDDVASEVSTLSLGQLILRDTFSDNKMASIWRVWADDVNQCWVAEANGRLEVRAKQTSPDDFAGYIANAWRLDPHDDFSLRADFHLDLRSVAKGWVSLGITPFSRTRRTPHVEIQARCADAGKAIAYECTESSMPDSSLGERQSDDGSLYISYNAAEDTLYVGAGGYGPDNAMGVFPGLLQGVWAGKPLYIYLGGGSEGLEITSGHAYLDNALVESGTVVEASVQEVYHFKSVTGEKHFYTMSEAEKEKLLTDYTRSWQYIGIAFYAYADNSDPDCKPVYRFWSTKLGSHFYTMNEDEKNGLMDLWGWSYEGVCFFAYGADHRPDWTVPVYRFWSKTRGSHYYTIDEAEKNRLMSNSIWTYEGIAWYAIQ
jgi:hypothetical protein